MTETLVHVSQRQQTFELLSSVVTEYYDRGETSEALESAQSYEGLRIPEGFEVTPFEEFLASLYNDKKQPPTSKEVSESLKDRFIQLGYPEVTIKPKDIDNYMDIYKGRAPGKSYAESPDRISDDAFPDIRSRYNAAYYLEDPTKFRPYRHNLLKSVAQSLAHGMTVSEIRERGGFTEVHKIVNMMKVDLLDVLEKGELGELEELFEQLAHVVDDHITNRRPKDDDDVIVSRLKTFREEIAKGRIFTGIPQGQSALSRKLAREVSEVWLARFAEADPHRVPNHVQVLLLDFIKQEPIGLPGSDRTAYSFVVDGFLKDYGRYGIKDKDNTGSNIVKTVLNQRLSRKKPRDIIASLQ